MTRTDSFVVGTLVVLLALIAGLVGAPSLLPATATVATPQPTPGPVAARPYARASSAARVGQPVDRADPGGPRPRRARLLRPRPQRPERHDRPGPRRALDGRRDRGRSGRSSCATTRAGTTASRSPRTTSRSRSASSRTRRTPGPAPGRGTRSPSRPRACDTIVFTLATPLGGFLQAATQPIAPAHLLADVPVDELADDAVRSPADRVRAVRRREPRRRARRAHPGGDDAPGRAADRPSRRPSPPTRWRPRSPTARPSRPVPYLAGIDFRSSTTRRRSPTRSARASSTRRPACRRR